MQTFLTITACLLYAAAFFILLKDTLRKNKTPSTVFLIFFAMAVLGHAFSLHYTVFPGQALHLGFFKVSSLIFCVIAVISLASAIRHMPIDNLLLVLFPFSIISIIVSQWVPSPTAKLITDKGLIAHIVLSILAYSLITIAALQAVMLAFQENFLRNHRFKGVFEYLPPLQTMETLLFEFIWLGFVLLSFSILSGFYFLEDMFAQHLVHKTALSLIAWGVFATLLFGRHLQGWRGKTATKWTISGFVVLMLAYFGTKFVLEIILHRV